jgi:hypothetical protein
MYFPGEMGGEYTEKIFFGSSGTWHYTACFLTTESNECESVPACESLAILIARLVALETFLLGAEDPIQFLDQFKELPTVLF